MTGETIPVHPHTVTGSEQLNEAMVRTYLESSGYGGEAAALMETARKFPRSHEYTADRHRYLVFIMPGGYWNAGDCTESEERIKTLRRTRRGWI